MWEKIMSVLKSKKFWTLVTAIVAALAAYFTVSCAAQARVQREGVHIDTVRVDYIIKSRNIQTLSLCPENKSRSIVDILTLTTSFPIFSSLATVGPRSEVFCSSISSTPSLIGFTKSSMPCLTSRFPFIITGNCFLESVRTIFSSRSPERPSGNSCSVISMIANLSFLGLSLPRSSARRGRGGKGRPKGTKSVPLGGSHL
nr:MAG TPA: hypothetical protein [Microviridae sp.]